MQRKRVLVAAHGNSLRSLILVLDNLSAKTIPEVELATGVPLLYYLNPDTTAAKKDVLKGLADTTE
jgi:2,3-bisphosphoglycerate-dependent phosphoglycerate mutase